MTSINKFEAFYDSCASKKNEFLVRQCRSGYPLVAIEYL